MEWHDGLQEADFRERPTNINRSQNIQNGLSGFVLKNKPAPLPPTSKHQLQKIGNYQPKILLGSKSPTDNGLLLQKSHENHNRHISDNVVVRTAIEVNSNATKPYIIGDKDVPLHLDSLEEDSFVTSQPVARPLGNKPPHYDVTVEHPEDLKRNNPLFDRSLSQRSDEIAFNVDFGRNDCGMGIWSGIDNPGFLSRDRKDRGSALQIEVIKSIPQKIENHVNDYPSIPPPDYCDEEVTIDIEEETSAVVKQTRNSAIHTEYKGDDFGKYLEDDQLEESYDVQNREQKRYGKRRASGSTYRGTNSKKAGNHRKASKQTNGVNARNTIRNFTFLDTKIGWGGDKTVNSTSTEGRYMKRERDRKRIDTSGQLSSGCGPGSYEDFLRIKNGISLEIPNSSNSGVDINDNSEHMDMYLHSQPREIRYGQLADHKPSMWQRLTWRFRKSVNISTHFQGERL